MAAVVCSHCGALGAEDQLITCVLLEGAQCSPCKEREALQRQIKKLRTKHDTSGSAINAIHDPFIHKLPPEIASRILSFSLPAFNSGEPQAESILGLWARPLKLGSVCRKWRQLAWATPDLWTTLCVEIKSSMAHSTAEALPGLLHEWLGRSGALPLTIYFFHKASRPVPEDELALDISVWADKLKAATDLTIEVLKLHSGRWRNLHITASRDLLERFSNSTVQSQLVTLELTAPIVRNSPLAPKFMPESLLNLTHIKLCNFPLKSINTRLDNITHATFSRISIDEGLDFLRRASSLEYYHVSMSLPHDIRFGNPLLHPRLRFLDLSTSYLGEVLEDINLPSLEEWTQKTPSRRFPMAPILSFLQRSGCCLKEFNLDDLHNIPEELDTLLQKTPALERFRLSCNSIYGDKVAMDNILTRIFYSVPEAHASASFLPRLQLLECKLDNPLAPFSWSYIPTFTRDDQRRSITLRAYAHKSEITDEGAAQLLKLINEGMDLQVIDEETGGDFLEGFRKRMHV